jgi:type IV pilus assembly protein PilA
MKILLKIGNSRGFTLIELIAVIAILGVLAAIIIPIAANYSERANYAVAKQNASVVLSASLLLSTRINNGENINLSASTLQQESNLSVIEGTEGVDNSVVIKVENNHLESIWSMSKGVLVHWNRLNGWTDSGTGENPDTGSSDGIVFNENTNLNEYITSGAWEATENGLYSDYGLLFIPNDNESYTITASATLGEATNYGTNSGGYGLLFETVLDKNNKDTGYSLQFDRGYNGIIIRQRANGNESGPIIAVTRKDNSLIPSSKRDEWWTETHTVVLSVTAIPN